jgi:hypothetical protein
MSETSIKRCIVSSALTETKIALLDANFPRRLTLGSKATAVPSFVTNPHRSRRMSALGCGFNRSLQHLLILPDEEVCVWRGMHGHGSRRSRRLSAGRAGRAVNVWRTSPERSYGRLVTDHEGFESITCDLLILACTELRLTTRSRPPLRVVVGRQT